MLKGCSLAALLHTILINCHLMIVINHHLSHTFLNNALSKEYIVMYVDVGFSKLDTLAVIIFITH